MKKFLIFFILPLIIGLLFMIAGMIVALYTGVVSWVIRVILCSIALWLMQTWKDNYKKFE